MEIIIPGDLNKAREKHLDIRTFICSDCECERTANNEEYTWGSQLESGPYMNWAQPMVKDLSIDCARLLLDAESERTNACPKAKKVYYNETAGVTAVLWMDGTKTIAKAAEGDKHDAYLGYSIALAKKIHGTNSALKRDLEKVLVITTKKENGNKDEKV